MRNQIVVRIYLVIGILFAISFLVNVLDAYREPHPSRRDDGYAVMGLNFGLSVVFFVVSRTKSRKSN